MSYFYSETNEWLKDGAKQWALLWSATTSRQFHRKFHVAWKQKWLVGAGNLQIIKTLLTLELSQFREIGIKISSSEPVAASRDCSQLGIALCLCLPVTGSPSDPTKLCQSAAPKAWHLILQSKPSIVFWNSLRKKTARWPALKLGLKREIGL